MEPENKILLLPSIVSALSSYETSRALIAMLIKLKHSRKLALREHFRPVIATQSHKEITHYEEDERARRESESNVRKVNNDTPQVGYFKFK